MPAPLPAPADDASYVAPTAPEVEASGEVGPVVPLNAGPPVFGLGGDAPAEDASPAENASPAEDASPAETYYYGNPNGQTTTRICREGHYGCSCCNDPSTYGPMSRYEFDSDCCCPNGQDPLPSSYSTPPSASILGIAMAPPGKYGL